MDWISIWKCMIFEFHHVKYCHEIGIECEYKNGEKNGKAKERYYLCCFHCGADIVFIGEYLNGKKWNGIVDDTVYNNHYELKNGKGYIIDINSQCFYEGEFING